MTHTKATHRPRSLDDVDVELEEAIQRFRRLVERTEDGRVTVEVERKRQVMRTRSTVPEFHEPTQEERAASLEAARKAREQVQAMAAGIGRAMP